MSTGTKTEINKLIARCRRVKWDVEHCDGGGYRVVNDTGRALVVHSSHASSGAAKRVERELNDLGLADREAEILAAREQAKEKSLATQRRKADTETKRLAAQSALTAKAAGPYAGPEAVPLEWFLKQHPAPWVRWVIIDPALAAALLKRNIDNRPMSVTTVAYYRTLIEGGHWRLTHQGMAMDVRGILQDGQQRLQACVEADTSIEVMFTVGLPVENFATIDEGRNRSIADLLGKEDVTDRNLVGTVVRLVAAYREPFPRQYLRVKTPNEVLYHAFKGDPERLVGAVRFGRQNYAAAKVVSSALGAAAYLLRDANGVDNDFVVAFLRGLASGVKGDSRLLLDADDPRLILRTTMERRRDRGHRLRAIDQLAFILTAWNAIVDPAHHGRRIKWTDGDDIPQIVVCRDKGRTASAVPEWLRGEFVAP